MKDGGVLKMNIAVIGASNNRDKFGNKCVRAYRKKGWEVFPVNNHEKSVEGLKAYFSVLDIPEVLDVVSVYLPPFLGMEVLPEISEKGVGKVFFNPGSESPELVARAEELGLNFVLECSIRAIGEDPADY